MEDHACPSLWTWHLMMMTIDLACENFYLQKKTMLVKVLTKNEAIQHVITTFLVFAGTALNHVGNDSWGS